MGFLGKLRQRLNLRSKIKRRINAKLIRRSEFFDAAWYLRNNPDVAATGIDPAIHYLNWGVKSNRNPSPYFTNEEYFALHNDVRASGMNPLLHYEKFGKREGRQIYLTETAEPAFPEGCVEGTWRFERLPRRHGRTAVVASYFGKGALPETLLYLLRGLHEVCDNIVYVADSPVLPEETEKLRNLVTIAKFNRHGQYDFGSYRMGLEIARSEGLLDASLASELVLINDSSYGPIYPFAESFEKMSERKCDFWGYTGYNAFGNIHISSYFYDFKRKVIDSGLLDEFLSGVRGKVERDKVIIKFEFRLTKFLEDAGLTWDTLVPMGFKKGAPTKYPLSLLRKFRMPLLKAKAVNGDSYENISLALQTVTDVNPALRALITPRPIRREHHLVTCHEHQASFRAKCEKIANKLKAGKKAEVVFFASSASMFPAKPLFDAMLSDANFNPRVVVIPDLRWRDGGESDLAMERCLRELGTTIPADRLSMATKDEFGTWDDVLDDVDIACYPSPYELSSFRYNPRYSVGRDFLPICVNYGFYRSKYDRIIMSGQSYAYMWKAFFECEDSLDEYTKYSVTGGSNADLTGYVKMDALDNAIKLSAASPVSPRKKILIAPHHSVDGGTNKSLSLANFIRYADYFLTLPDHYPEIDFIFRPHPFLFKVMARPSQWGQERVDEYIAKLKAKPNLIWSDGGDYFKEFAESDACIQDCGSYLVEYFYTKKPCCYMLKSPADIEEKFAPLGVKCLDNCYIAYDTNAIERFIRDVVVAGNDPKKAQREAFADSIMVNYPHAAEIALEHIKRDIIGQQGISKPE